MRAIFISHSSIDRKITDDIKDFLAELKFDRVFLDYDEASGIPLGAQWEKHLHDELARCHAIILVLTQNWLASKWCFAELIQARSLGKIILPIICEPLGNYKILPEIQSGEILDWNQTGLAKLKRRLDSISSELARGFRLDPARPAFPGIHAFEAEDAAIYFGRDDETRAVIERLDARRTHGGARLVLIIGASGSGKSSLLMAGILPQLARKPQQWICLPPMRPEKAPMEALAKVLTAHLAKPDEWRSWRDKLSGSNSMREFEELVKDLRVGAARAATVLLSIDQFEEVFTVAAADERTEFLRLLAAGLDPERDLPVIGIATGRSDVLDGLIQLTDLAKLTETYPLVPMPLDRVPRLIEGPAETSGLNVEKGLSERIARDVESPDALPLLAYTLSLLYHRGIEKKTLSLGHYQSLGDPARRLNPIQNSVRLVADQAIAGLKPGQVELDALRDAFVPHLVRLRLDDGTRVRRPAPLSELPEASRRLVGALVEARLLSTRAGDNAPQGAVEHSEAVVEVVHEALFKAWPTLDAWLTEEQAFLSDLERIRSDHEIWVQASEQQKPNALLRGLLLSRARDWLLKYPGRFLSRDMTPMRTFIAASAEAEAAERDRAQRLRRRMFQIALGAAAVFSVAAAFAGWQYLEAEDARVIASNERAIAVAGEILATSQVQEAVNTECSLGLALAAYDAAARTTGIDRLPFETAIRNILGHSRVIATLPAAPRALYTLSWRPDGTALAFVDDAGKVQIWSTDTGSTRILDKIEDATGVEWRLDGQRLAVISGTGIATWDPSGPTLEGSIALTGAGLARFRWDKDGNRALVWSRRLGTLLLDMKSGKVRPLGAPTSVPRGDVWSPDAKRVAIAAGSNEVWVVDLDEGKYRALRHPEPVVSVAWSPDGGNLAIGLDSGRIWIWDPLDGSRKETLDGHTNQVQALDFSPDGTGLVSASWDHQLIIWDTRTWRARDRLTGHSAGLTEVRWSPAGNQIASRAVDGTTRIWSAKSARSPETVLQTRGWVWSVGWNADGTLLGIAADDMVAVRQGNALPQPLASATRQIKAGSWAASGSRYAFVEDGGRLVVIDAAPRTRVMEKPIDAGLVLAVALSADGTLAAATSEDGISVWSVPDGALKLHLDAPASALAFSPKDNLVAYAPLTGRTIEIVNVDSTKPYISLPGIDPTKSTWGLAWSHDGRRLAAASDDSTAHIWDLSSPERPSQLSGHGGDVKGVAWAPGDDRLATASLDTTARIWDLASSKTIAILAAHASGVRAVAWSPDGESLVTGAEDGTARIFRAKFDDVLALARQQEQIGMTEGEREQCMRAIKPGGRVAPGGRNAPAPPTASPVASEK